jgi:DNA-binding MarR family transcriptional regulator
MKLTPERILIIKTIENHNSYTHRRPVKSAIQKLTGLSASCVSRGLSLMIEIGIVNGPGKGYRDIGYSLTPKGRNLLSELE